MSHDEAASNRSGNRRAVLAHDNPAPTQPAVATVVALEDCRIAAPLRPVAAPLQELRVALASHWLMRAPARAFRPSAMTIMPGKKHAHAADSLYLRLQG
jgi:hypothetical protein